VASGPIDDLVFTSPIGTPLDPHRVGRAVKSITTEAVGEPWTPHEMRHSAASLMLAQGVPLKTVSETLGRSSIRVTADVYGHLLEPAKTEAADAMDRVLFS
jgi:integrase